MSTSQETRKKKGVAPLKCRRLGYCTLLPTLLPYVCKGLDHPRPLDMQHLQVSVWLRIPILRPWKFSSNVGNTPR